MTKHSQWLVQDNQKTEQILEKLQAHFTLEPMQIQQETLTFYDDFEWRLWKKNRLLASNHKGLTFFINHLELQTYRAEPIPSFAENCLDPQLRAHVWEHTDGRRLFPMADMEVEYYQYALRNEDLKKVCDLKITQTGLGAMIELIGLRGYEKAYREALGVVLSSEPDSLEQHIFQLSLALLDICPTCYSRKPKFAIAPNDSVASAITNISTTLWKNVRINETGIAADWDRLFLHQYRVALRRSRALFSQLKQAIQPEQQQFFKLNLGELARKTNRLRDLDVYLQRQEAYKQLLPQQFHQGLDELFAEFADQRKQAHRALSRWIKSPGYQNKIAELELQLTNIDFSDRKQVRQPVQKLAAQRLLKSYNKIITQAQRINAYSADDEIHEIRLEAKKLRYLLEFFTDLFQDKQAKASLKALLKALKKLQDSLGAFNDFAVQRAYLEHWISAPNPDELEDGQHAHPSEAIVAAVHALSGVLFVQQQTQRLDAENQLSAFIENDMSSALMRLYLKPEIAKQPADQKD